MNARIHATVAVMAAVSIGGLVFGTAQPARAAKPAPEKPFRVPAATQQLVVVTSADFPATIARLARYERQRSKGHGHGHDDEMTWKLVGAPIDVVLGKGGLGWGRGLYPPMDKTPPGPTKHEGDGRSPAGVFKLLESTGYTASPPAGASLKYREATARLRCVDDTESPEYNQLALAPESGAPSWKSDESMRRADDLYQYVIVVEHNREPVERGAGSCIFLHVWRGPSSTTVGCTAMTAPDIETLLTWLDARRAPLLVQMPRAQYDSLRETAGLPRLETPVQK